VFGLLVGVAGTAAAAARSSDYRGPGGRGTAVGPRPSAGLEGADEEEETGGKEEEELAAA
jgi:hypothetical protein